MAKDRYNVPVWTLIKFIDRNRGRIDIVRIVDEDGALIEETTLDEFVRDHVTVGVRVLTIGECRYDYAYTYGQFARVLMVNISGGGLIPEPQSPGLAFLSDLVKRLQPPESPEPTPTAGLCKFDGCTSEVLHDPSIDFEYCADHLCTHKMCGAPIVLGTERCVEHAPPSFQCNYPGCYQPAVPDRLGCKNHSDDEIPF